MKLINFVYIVLSKRNGDSCLTQVIGQELTISNLLFGFELAIFFEFKTDFLLRFFLKILMGLL